MKKDDKKTLIIFFVIIFLILIVFIYNIYINRKLDNVDRKVEYIFNTLTYKEVYNKSSELLNYATSLVLDNILTYEKNSNGKINYYSINTYNKYKKITNFWIVTNTFSKNEIDKFIEYKKIIKSENNYYIESYQSKFSNYVGSIIEIDNYDNSYVYFNSENYYCNDYEYIGVLEEIPNCNYQKEETKFSIVLENNKLRINSLEEIKNIVK